MHAFIHTHVHVRKYIHMCACMYLNIHIAHFKNLTKVCMRNACVYEYAYYISTCVCHSMHLCMLAYMHACMYACIYVCMYVCMYVFMHVCTYVCQ